MSRAHLQRPVLDSAGNVRLNAVVRVLEPNSATPISQALYVGDGGQETLPNPHTFADGVVNFYLNEPQRVRLGIKFGSGAEFFYEDIDILPVDHIHAASTIAYASQGNIITSDNVQGAIASLEALLDPETADFATKDEMVEATVGPVLPDTTDRLVGDSHLIPATETDPAKDYRLVDLAGVLTWVELGVGGTANTSGPGEPTTDGRKAGDAHWDETAETLLVLTGDPLAWLDVLDPFITEDEADLKYALKEEPPLAETDPETGDATTFVPSFSLQTIVQGDLVAGATNISAPGLRVVKASTAKVLVVHIGTPPTGSAAVIEFTRTNGGTGTQPLGSVTIAEGQSAGFLTINEPCAKGDMIRQNVISVGSTVAGADVNLAVDFL